MSNERMTPARFAQLASAVFGALVLTLASASPATAQTAKPASSATAAPAAPKAAAAAEATRKPVRQNTARKPVVEPEPVVVAADDTQMTAHREVMLGASACEFGQRINVDSSDKHPGYLDLSFNNRKYLMKPVMSSTGALRLEDVRAETLLIQIGNKTMLMNQKTGQRLVDNCIHPQHQTIASTQGSSLGIEAPK